MLFPVIALLNSLQVQSADSGEKKLIRINEWQDITVDGSSYEDTLLDFHLFATCQKFSLLFATEQDGSTFFRFSFDDATLKKIDVESMGRAIEIPSTPKLIGTCREKHRKILRIKVKTSNDSIAFKIDDQLIRRPYDLNGKRVRVLVPQAVPCCLIRGLFLSNQDFQAYSSTSAKYQNIHSGITGTVNNSVREGDSSFETKLMVHSPSTTTASAPDTTTTETTQDTNKWSKFTLGKNPTISSTSKPKPESSWTHAVNKEWSITFVLCSIVICAIMLFLAVFGTFTVFYLMTKPQDGKSPFAVDA